MCSAISQMAEAGGEYRMEREGRITMIQGTHVGGMRLRILVEAAMYKLPSHLGAWVYRSPKAGEGVHKWLYKAALRFHHFLDPDLVTAMLWNGVKDCGRTVLTREVNDAVAASLKVYGRADPLKSPAATALIRAVPKNEWPMPNCTLRRQIISDNPATLDQLRANSPYPLHSSYGAEGFVRFLFPGSALLCCGAAPHTFQTKSCGEWGAELDKLALIVPSPMSAPTGLTKEGKTSARSSNNTGRRMYLVVEFDTGSFDDQTTLICHLSKRLPLVMVVHSGNKSLHAWFYVVGRSDESVRQFFDHAIVLGADSATWLLCQMVRMPGGVRHTERGPVRQEVLWLNPNFRKA